MSPRRKRGPESPPEPEEFAGEDGRAGLPVPVLALCTFLTGFSVLAVEIAGPKLLAPWLGDSLYTWSTTIAVVLGAMAAGYVAGGWLADRRPDAQTFFLVILAGGALTALIPPLSGAVTGEDLARMSPVGGTVYACLILFAPPCLVLSMSWPFAVRLVFSTGSTLGRRAGFVGSASTLGSIAGAVGGGWLLVPALGIRSTFWVAAAIPVLTGTAGLLFCRIPGRTKAAGIVLALAALGAGAWPEPRPENGVIHREHSFYHRIDVTEEGTVRYLRLNSTYEGGRDMETGELAFEYLKYWPLMLDSARPPRKLLFLGAGAYSLPGFLAERYPDAGFTVVDIDPALHRVASRYFGADDIPHLVRATGDARRFLIQDTSRYDAIFADTYQGVNRIPPHLSTVEYFRLIRSRLTPEGRLLINVIGAKEGDGSRLPGGMISALREAFPHVRVFATRYYDGRIPQNLMLLASNEAVPMDRDERFHPFQRMEVKWMASYPAFTDDHAPVDALAALMLKRSF
ncbi:MAG: fused MFS/spermidine synthase [Deltaproteobacteria bacterium]|nr:fused MFS/spermidine synthase [Deltaproteobacteria bacterium]